MDAIQLQFERGMDELRGFIESYIVLDELIHLTKSKKRRGALATKMYEYVGLLDGNSRVRRFQFNSAIISSFGLFETFVDELLAYQTSILCAMYGDFEALPESVKSSYKHLSVEMLMKSDNVRNVSHSPKDIVNALNHCLNNSVGVKLLSGVIGQRSANYRKQVIDEMFRRVGVENITVRAEKLGMIDEFLKQKSFDARGFSLLNIIADTRNSVAHGENASYESFEIQIVYVEYLKEISNSLVAILKSENIRMLAHTKGIQLNNYLNKFRSHIIAFKPTPIDVNINDAVAYCDGNDIWHISEIKSIQVNNVNVKKAYAGDSDGVGVAIEQIVGNSEKFYIIRSSDSPFTVNIEHRGRLIHQTFGVNQESEQAEEESEENYIEEEVKPENGENVQGREK